MKAFLDYLCEISATTVSDYEIVEADNLRAINKSIRCKVHQIHPVTIYKRDFFSGKLFSDYGHKVEIKPLKLLDLSPPFRGYRYRQISSYFISLAFHPVNIPTKWRFI